MHSHLHHMNVGASSDREAWRCLFIRQLSITEGGPGRADGLLDIHQDLLHLAAAASLAGLSGAGQKGSGRGLRRERLSENTSWIDPSMPSIQCGRARDRSSAEYRIPTTTSTSRRCGGSEEYF